MTGGAGYVGAVLVPQLLSEGHKITVLDLMMYGQNVLQKNKNLQIIKGDIRDKELLRKTISGHDSLIHLACISNDPSFELNPKLGKSINLDSFRPLVEVSRESGIKRFIYASSSSVYGVKKEKKVHENMSLEPLTDYSKYKAECEEIISEYISDEFTTVTIRPATVCGFSPRQRLDVVVNILTNLAFHKREITVFGGDQLRPNIHIKDMAEAYSLLLKAPKDKVIGKVFNAGFENQTVSELAEIVKEIIGKDVNLVKSETDDNRSYHISSAKFKKELGFKTMFTVADAVKELKHAFLNNLLKDPLTNEMYSNIKRMQSLNLK